MNIDFERFKLEAGLVGYICQVNGSEIWQARLWANGGVFRNFNGDDVYRVLIGPGFQPREFGCQAAFGMLLGVAGFRRPFGLFHIGQVSKDINSMLLIKGIS